MLGLSFKGKHQAVVLSEFESVVMIACMSASAMSLGPGPADGYDLHVYAPHFITDGEV